MTARPQLPLDIHLVYPCSDAAYAPYCIGRELTDRFRRDGHSITLYKWDGREKPIPTGPRSILLGHPHPDPSTTFRVALERPGWLRKIAIKPFNHGDGMQTAHLEPILRRCDAFIAITGRYWMATLEQSPVAHWKEFMTQVDLAVRTDHFPPIKTCFNPAGQRRFLYIGHSEYPKNTSYLGQIASFRPSISFSWCGEGRPIPHVAALGPQDFQTDNARELVAKHDFLIHTSHSDANPTTILESMAWGLIPVCTPQSGYHDQPGIFNIPLDDPQGACRVLDRLNGLDEQELLDIQRENRKTLAAEYTWEAFYQTVNQALFAPHTPIQHPDADTQASLAFFRRMSPLYTRRLDKADRKRQQHKQRLWRIWYGLTNPCCYAAAMRHLRS